MKPIDEMSLEEKYQMETALGTRFFDDKSFDDKSFLGGGSMWLLPKKENNSAIKNIINTVLGVCNLATFGILKYAKDKWEE